MRKPKNELTNDQTVLKIMELLREQRKTEKDLERYIGLSNGTFTRWKYRGSKTYIQHIEKIAEYLDVPSKYLKSEVENVMESYEITKEELRLIQFYRRMGKDKQDVLLKSAVFFVELADLKKGNENEDLDEV